MILDNLDNHRNNTDNLDLLELRTIEDTRRRNCAQRDREGTQYRLTQNEVESVRFILGHFTIRTYVHTLHIYAAHCIAARRPPASHNQQDASTTNLQADHTIREIICV